MTFVQKLALSTSLCLTIILIALSITRASGLVWKGKMDYVWEFYWIIMSANVGVILASASAFRAFFVAQKNNKTSPYPPIRTPDDNSGTSSKRRLTLRTRERTFRPIEDSFFEIDMTRNTRSHERVESVTLNDMGCDSQRYIRRNDIAYPRAVVVGEQV